MVGGTLGAGVGRYQGVHGLIIDALESVELVTAAGDLIQVSRDQEPDLFWGLRGAGSVMNVDFEFAGTVNQTFFEFLASFNGKLPPKLAFFGVLANDAINGPSILLNAVYIGPQEEGLAYLKPLLDLPYLRRNITQLTWNTVFGARLFGIAATCIDGKPHDNWSQGVANIGVPTHVAHFNALADLWAQHPVAVDGVLPIEVFSPQTTLTVSDEETAYPYRNTAIQLILDFPVNDDAVTNFAEQWIPEFTSTGGFNQSRVCVSYAHGYESLETKYGQRKLPRLLELKKKWDPKGFFSFNKGLPGF